MRCTYKLSYFFIVSFGHCKQFVQIGFGITNQFGHNMVSCRNTFHLHLDLSKKIEIESLYRIIRIPKIESEFLKKTARPAKMDCPPHFRFLRRAREQKARAILAQLAYKVNKQTNKPFLWNPCCNIHLVNHETFLVVLLMLANFRDKADNCSRSYTSLNFELFHLLSLRQKSDSKCQ